MESIWRAEIQMKHNSANLTNDEEKIDEKDERKKKSKNWQKNEYKDIYT